MFSQIVRCSSPSIPATWQSPLVKVVTSLIFIYPSYLGKIFKRLNRLTALITFLVVIFTNNRLLRTEREQKITRNHCTVNLLESKTLVSPYFEIFESWCTGILDIGTDAALQWRVAHYNGLFWRKKNYKKIWLLIRRNDKSWL